MDPKNRDELLEVAARVSKLPASAFGVDYTKKDLYRDPDMIPDIDSFQRSWTCCRISDC